MAVHGVHGDGQLSQVVDAVRDASGVADASTADVTASPTRSQATAGPGDPDPAGRGHGPAGPVDRTHLQDIHPLSALRPEEDVLLFCDTGMLAVPVAAPAYLHWLQATDPTPGYQTYRRHLQALLQDRPGRRPVRSPPSTWVDWPLLVEVPAATVVWTHRGPAVALARWCSLAAVLASAAGDQVDLGALGRRWVGFWVTELDRALAARTTADRARFHDVGYQALVADPLGEVERLYARLGLELSGGARQRTRRWIGRHHRGRTRPHRYSLADFWLDRLSSTGVSRATANGWRRSPRRDPADCYQRVLPQQRRAASCSQPPATVRWSGS